MKVIWGLEAARNNPRTITTLGSYDGVHLGHRAILQKLQDRKQTQGMERSLLVTFHPHPQQVLRKNDSSVQLLTSIEERLALLAECGIDETLVIEFTKEFSQTSYIDFFRKTLVEKLGTKMMVVGFNHAFGKNREGNAEHLKVLAPELGVSVDEMPPLSVQGISISSTKIRHALGRGEVAEANRMLGRCYSFSGTVIAGDQIGSKIGYPTANLVVPEEKLIPADGVYACRVWLGGETYDAALSIGHRPTIGQDFALAIELFLFHFTGDLYGERVRVDCIEYLRPQKTFDSVELLRKQIEVDVQECMHILGVDRIFV